jgi:hypothetical protein
VSSDVVRGDLYGPGVGSASNRNEYQEYVEINQSNSPNYILLYFSFTMAPTCFGNARYKNTKEYQEYFLEGKCGRYLGLTTLPPSCDFL